MKIGILTYHRTLNYGGCLQALATRLLLEKLGHDVYYVDYWPEYHQKRYEPFSKYELANRNIKGKIVYLLSFWRYIKFYKYRRNSFNPFLEKFIIPFCKPTSEHFDAIIYGSDQIWRVQKELGSYNPMYFGNNELKANLHIAFSASMGILPKTGKELSQLKELLTHLDCIGVREESLLNVVKQLGYKDAVQTIDPTLMIDADIWNKYFTDDPYRGKNYVLVYNLWGDAFDSSLIKNIAEKNGSSIITIRGNATHLGSESEITIAPPEDFISLIRNAQFVFTSSFHGLAFSLIYKKQVLASFVKNGDRAKSLLESIGISGRYLEPKAKDIVTYEDIDYSKVENNIEKLRDDSIKFLANSLSIKK